MSPSDGMITVIIFELSEIINEHERSSHLLIWFYT